MDAPEDPALRESVLAVAHWLRSDIDAAAARIVARIGDACAEDGAIGTDVPLGEQMANFLRIAHTVLDALIEARPFKSGELDAIRKIGARHAQQGLSTRAVQRSVGIARDLGWEFAFACTERLPVSTRSRALARLARHTFHLSDEVLGALMKGHAQGRNQERTSFFAQLLAGDPQTAHALSLLAPAFGIDLERPQGLFVVASTQGDCHAACKMARRVVDELGGCDVLKETSAKPHAGVVVEADDAEQWADQLRRAGEMLARSPTVAIAAGPLVGAEAIRRAYDDALAVLPITLCMERDGTIVTARELRLHRLLVGLDRQLEERFVDETVGPLLQLPGAVRDRLVRTLRALDMSGGRLVVAAKALGVSEQTVRNRLATVRSLVDPDVRPDELAVALRLVDVLGKPGAGSHAEGHRAH